jgi:hypothetical protein
LRNHPQQWDSFRAVRLTLGSSDPEHSQTGATEDPPRIRRRPYGGSYTLALDTVPSWERMRFWRADAADWQYPPTAPASAAGTLTRVCEAVAEHFQTRQDLDALRLLAVRDQAPRLLRWLRWATAHALRSPVESEAEARHSRRQAAAARCVWWHLAQAYATEPTPARLAAQDVAHRALHLPRWAAITEAAATGSRQQYAHWTGEEAGLQALLRRCPMPGAADNPEAQRGA